uniref:Uncharacterized protein n=1 Tax=Batrachochytrium dendrobatidis (strain JAM81 / FGSC 10211) TaxID=684364 RepID=F4PEZ6_BATDJ|eukprot:XP_006683177.1 hypothetical protein BATDEDRAFT_92944 [Batrachochytrium dendrobatidis JAM81]
MAGFATARGKVSPVLVGASFATTYSSANLFIGVPGLAYEFGTSVLWYTLGCFGVSWIGLLLFAKTFWRYNKKFGGVSTLPEWLGRRYNSKALQVIVAVLILFNVYYIVGQNVGLATIFESVLNIPYYWGIIIGVGITILYIGLGGAYAQMITDGFQGILMAITSILVFVSLFWTIGGGWNVFGELTNKLGAIDPNLTGYLSVGGPYDSILAVMAVQFLLFSFVLMPHLLNKVLSLESEEQLAPFTLSAGIVLFFISTLMVLGGLAARVIFPSLSSSDAAIPAYVIESFPPILAAIIIIGIITAILSSTDSLYLGITSSIGNDFYKIVRSPYRWELNLVCAAIISGILAPVTLGYFWKKANGAGAIAAVITVSAFVVMIVTCLLTQDATTSHQESITISKKSS